jgi:DNA-binding NarL/FixJ family response regulator
MDQITVLFVDDHPLIRKAWDFILAQDSRFKLIGECESGEIAIELSKQLNPDVVIMDIRLPGMNGIETTRLIKKNSPDVKVIGLSFDIRPENAQKMMQSGATGYLTKISSPDEIFRAIIEVKKGRTYICQEMANRVTRDLPS